jgi:hypothetical protein
MPRASTNGANCDVKGEVGCDVKRDVNGVADAIEKLRRSRSITKLTTREFVRVLLTNHRRYI